MKVEINVLALEKIIEIARMNETIKTKDLLAIAGIELPTDASKKKPVEYSKKGYTTEEKSEFDRVILLFGKAKDVNMGTRERLQVEMNRTPNAIYNQLLIAEKKLKEKDGLVKRDEQIDF